MVERLLVIAMSSPSAVIALGRSLLWGACVSAMLGIAMSRAIGRATRVMSRAGLEAPDMLAGLPMWMRLIVPESLVGWVLVALVAVAGVALVRLGKWARAAA